MLYRFVGYTMADGIASGIIHADSEELARAEVVHRGLKPLKVAKAYQPPRLDTVFPSLFAVKSGEVVLFARQLATMLASGGNLLRALQMLHGESQGGAMKRTLADIRKSVDAGMSFSDALKRHPKVFSPLFVSVVTVGEFTGRLAPALEQLADMLEKDREAKQKTIRTMMYPMAIIALSFLTMGVLMAVAMPALLKVFSQLGAEVPLMTRLAVGSMSWVRSHVREIAFGLLGLVVLVAMLRRHPRTRAVFDASIIRLPTFGAFVVTGEIARFSRTTAMLLDSGVPLVDALQLSVQGCGNEVVRRALRDGEESLLTGHSLTEALKRHPVIPTLFLELLVIGEETNSLGRTLNDAAIAYQKQLERWLDALLAFLEPASTVIVGGIVGFIAFSMFVPIYSGLQMI